MSVGEIIKEAIQICRNIKNISLKLEMILARAILIQNPF